MKKLYYAYVSANVATYFEERLHELNDKIKVVLASPGISENGAPLMRYVLEAEEGIIDSKWELK